MFLLPPRRRQSLPSCTLTRRSFLHQHRKWLPSLLNSTPSLPMKSPIDEAIERAERVANAYAAQAAFMRKHRDVLLPLPEIHVITRTWIDFQAKTREEIMKVLLT